MIKSGGENVASVKIEETLLAHPDVLSAAVVEAAASAMGQAVSAFVKLKPNAQARETDIIEHCRKTLGGFQIPETGAHCGRNADDRDRQAAQGQIAPAIRRHSTQHRRPESKAIHGGDRELHFPLRAKAIRPTRGDAGADRAGQCRGGSQTRFLNFHCRGIEALAHMAQA